MVCVRGSGSSQYPLEERKESLVIRISTAVPPPRLMYNAYRSQDSGFRILSKGSHKNELTHQDLPKEKLAT